MANTAYATASETVGAGASSVRANPLVDFTDVAARISQSKTGDQVWQIMSEVCQQTDIQGACCRCFPSNASAAPTVFFSTTEGFNEELAAALQDAPGYLDAFLHASVKSPKPFRWSDVNTILDAKSPQISSYRREIASLGDGIVVPVFGPLFRHGYFCFHGREGREYDDTEILMMHSISQTAYLKLLDVMYRDDIEGRSLSSRELEIINLIARGQSNQSVAAELSVSINTINTYMKRIFEKLDVSDRVSAVMRAYALGFIA
ncbi:MAG: LuxR family transcriptional regulator [Hyphomonas sp.]|nr:LuxR family transcriptional regulator [Hyphomonas sp.]